MSSVRTVMAVSFTPTKAWPGITPFLKPGKLAFMVPAMSGSWIVGLGKEEGGREGEMQGSTALRKQRLSALGIVSLLFLYPSLPPSLPAFPPSPLSAWV